jgi:transcription elongation factor Elf1
MTKDDYTEVRCWVCDTVLEEQGPIDIRPGVLFLRCSNCEQSLRKLATDVELLLRRYEEISNINKSLQDTLKTLTC